MRNDLIRGGQYSTYIFTISVDLKSGLIRTVAFGGSGLIRGVAFGGNGIIRLRDYCILFIKDLGYYCLFPFSAIS